MSEFIRTQLIRVLKRLSWLFPDRLYLQLFYRLAMNSWPRLDHPILFSEKMQWLKLNLRKPFLNMLVDKLAVKEYVGRHLGKEYICSVLGVWNNVGEIDIASLPKQFVLKTTHGGGNEGVVVCKDKDELDWDAAKAKLRENMKVNIYDWYREWPYKNVERRIFAEKYLGDNILDYKFYCCNGEVMCILLCVGRQEGHVKYFFLDKEWHLRPYNKDSIELADEFSEEKPENLPQMLEIAVEMSKGFPFVRIDLFDVNGRIYFGEYTFFPASGLDPNKTTLFEQLLGEKIDLSLCNAIPYQ